MTTPFIRSRQGLTLMALAVLAAVVVITGMTSRRSHAEALQSGSAARSVPTVVVITPAAAKSAPLELPARIEPWARAPIYARSSGYLKRWTVDIGGSVKAGQLLGEIESPELDQQLLQAKAELATARSNLSLSTTTAQRWKGLLAADAVSRQEADEKAGDLAARQSVVSAQQANVDRVHALQGYLKLVAPFDGVVTERNTDVGALISVGGGVGTQLFVVSDLRKLRIYVNVPQRQVAQVKAGVVAQLSVPERPGRSYAATVQSLSQSINAGSGTMLVQLSVDNSKGELLPGGYATLKFAFADSGDTVSVSPSAVIFGRNGAQVATVGADNRVLLKSVTVARDLGSSIELAGGITKSDRIIDSPPDGIVNGDQVRVAAAPAATKGKP